MLDRFGKTEVWILVNVFRVSEGAMTDKDAGIPRISRASSESICSLSVHSIYIPSPTSVNRVFLNHTQTDNVITFANLL